MRCAEVAGIEGEVINLGTGSEISIDQLAGRILRLAGRDLTVGSSAERIRPPASEVDRLLADAGKARALLDWTPRILLEDGLRRTIDWMRNALDSYEPSVYGV
jgi:dTDP-glucose 4,6-dehydratase